MLQPDQRSEISWIQLRDTDTAVGALTPSSQSGDLVTAEEQREMLGDSWETEPQSGEGDTLSPCV